MPKGQRKNSKKKGVVRRKSRTQKNKKSTMKGGDVDDSTTWTATDKDGGKWEVESGTKIEEIYKLENDRLHILNKAEKVLITTGILTKSAYNTAGTTLHTRAELKDIKATDTWDDNNGSDKVTGYASVVATDVKKADDNKLGSVKLTFTKQPGVADQLFDGPVTFVLLDVNK